MTEARIRLRTWITAAAVLAAVTLTYSNHFRNNFQFDDFHSITDNTAIRTLAKPARFFLDAGTSSVLPSHQVWRPLVTLSLALDYWRGGGYNPVSFHVSNFLWFLAVLVSLGLLFQTILDPLNFWIAWLAAAWFGLHPAIAETVNYIIQRADIISTWGIVAGLAIYAQLPQLRKYGLYLFPVGVGFLAKPPALIFPAVLAAYIVLIEGASSWKRILLQAIPSLGLTSVFLALQASLTAKSFDPGSVSAYRYLITQPYVWFRYFVSFFLPLHLSADTDLEPLSSLLTLEALGGFLFVAILLVSIYAAAKHPAGRPVAFGLAWFVLGLIPTSVFPLAEVENDHRMFLPFAGLVLAVTWSAACFASRFAFQRNARVVTVAAALCLLLLYAGGTRRRNEVWRTEESLWEDVTFKSPKNGRGLMNYGLARMSRGDFGGALTLFERALVYTPNYPELEINLGIDCGALGRDADAEQHFSRAILLSPQEAQSHYFYARWLKGKGRADPAEAQLQEAIRLNPAYMQARVLLLDAYATLRQWPQLDALAHETLRLAPGDPTVLRYATLRHETPPSVLPAPETLLDLSLAAYRKNDFQGCIRFAQLALKQRPRYAEAYNNLIAAYNSLGQWDQAIHAGQEALRIQPGYELARNNLLWAESQKNRKATWQR